MKKTILTLASFALVFSSSVIKAAEAETCEALLALCLIMVGPGDPVGSAGCMVYYALCSIFG